MPGLQTCAITIPPVTKREIDRLHYLVALLRKALDDLTARVDVLSATMEASDHALLDNLDYVNSGHTGFQAEITDRLRLVNGNHIAEIKLTSSGGVEIWVDGTKVYWYP